MTTREYALKRVEAFLDEIDRHKHSEFPYPHSRLALKALHDLGANRKARLEDVANSGLEELITLACSEAINELIVYLPLLGFIVGSTNVRNAFEVFGPLFRMACDVLEPRVQQEHLQTRLVLSSEWEYSPFIYTGITGLPGFVLIGLPAPESSNPLLIPLAGHELGHSVWSAFCMEARLQEVLKQTVVDVITDYWKEYQAVYPNSGAQSADALDQLSLFATWSQADEWAMDQAQETFCDLIGLKIFGSSYLHAFAYLLAPNSRGARVPEYPNLCARVHNLAAAASEAQIDVGGNFEMLFQDLEPPELSDVDEFLLFVADRSLERLQPKLLAEANRIISDSTVSLSTPDEVERIVSCFSLFVPASDIKGLPDITNAAWAAYHNESLWSDLPLKQPRDLVLKELVLKTIEIFEIERIVMSAA